MAFEPEEWRPVVGYEDYYDISSYGRIRSKRPAKAGILRPVTFGGGKHIGLSKDGKRRCKLIHVLVLEAFVGPKPDGKECAHFDGNNRNNRLGNLRWATPKENSDDKTRHGTQTAQRAFREISGEKYYQCNACKEWIARAGFYRLAARRSRCGIASECSKCSIKRRIRDKKRNAAKQHSII